MADPTYFYSTYNPKFEPYMIAIGRIATKWAEFEFALNDTIWELSNVERMAGSCATAQMIGPGPRFRCLAALFHLRKVPAELVNALNSLSVEAATLGAKRNRYVHDPVILNPEDGTVAKVEATADRTMRHNIFPIDITKLNGLVADIENLEERFNALYQRVRAETPPWPRTQFEQSWGIHREYLGQDSSQPKP